MTDRQELNRFGRKRIIDEPTDNIIIECLYCWRVAGKTLNQDKWKISIPSGITYSWKELNQSKCHNNNHYWAWRKNANWDSKIINGETYYWHLSKPEIVTKLIRY